MEKIIWVAGMPRSGSMWTFNVLKDALAAMGYNVLPKHVPKTNDETVQIARDVALADPNPKNVYVFKTHIYLNPDIPRSYFLTTIRDVRDALISWMRFMNSDFEIALSAAEGMTRNCDHYLSFPEERHGRINYRDIVERPEATMKKICQWLSLDIRDESISDIVKAHDKNSVAKRIKEKEKNYNEKRAKGEASGNIETVAGYNDSVRLYDNETGFQSGHVTDYQDGDWASILTPEQIKAMNERLSPWLERNGFL